MTDKKIISIEELYENKLPPDLVSAHFEQAYNADCFFYFQKQFSQNQLFTVKTFLVFLAVMTIAILTGEKYIVSVPKFSVFISFVFFAATGYQYRTGKILLNKANIISQRGIFLEKAFSELEPFFQENERIVPLNVYIKPFLIALFMTYIASSISFVLGSYFCVVSLGHGSAIALAAFLTFFLSVLGAIRYRSFKESIHKKN
ncbi:MAG: hypothetical protein SNF33_00185 (plasmid) [Candidatus Algichlamydia australiensis]|nr:hypothetical protein [Chlamydiales bacterium]